MTAAATPADEWKHLPWKRFERQVFKLQTRIYRAKQRGNVTAVRKLQRLLVRSWSAKCLAVRRVTQDNRGKRTAGVDGMKNLTPRQRLQLATSLRLLAKASPLRRVWIPKPGTDEQRPLSIPVMRDRAAQALLTLALEPEWEAVFEPNSYGFRPGRSGHDAIAALHTGLNQKARYVLDADITKCFDRIDHVALLDKLHTTPAFRRAIRAWLKAGVMDGPTLFPTDAGTPQGGVISPLLANIALHGLETALREVSPHLVRQPNGWWERPSPIVVRYADDFVVLHHDLALVQQTQQIATAWLRSLGLELKPSKTRIVHSLHEHAGQPPGFDFLGFHIRQYPVGKTHSGKRSHAPGAPAARLGFKTRTTPSTTAIRKHEEALRLRLRQYRAVPQTEVIRHLNPLIRGWAAYFSTAAAKAALARMDFHTFVKLKRWARRRHPHKSWRWIKAKYWRLETGTWTFGTREGDWLRRHDQTPIRRHIKVRGQKSPYDGDWRYWALRLGRHPELYGREALLLQQQHGRCRWCGLYFREKGGWELDHMTPLAAGGPRTLANLQLLHPWCHDAKTAAEAAVGYA
jgi:RNA-directed DNA polymerase